VAALHEGLSVREFGFANEAITETELRSRVIELGEAITADYRGRQPLFVSMLTGAVSFTSDLVRAFDDHAEVDFMALNRFGEGGRIGIAMDLSTSVLDRNVIIVEDVVDTGLTLSVLRRMMMDRGVASVATVTLFDKARRRVNDVPLEYRGFEVGDEFLLGYGLDWQGLYRNLPSIWVVMDMQAFIDDPHILARNLGHI
jgi:hypoxanthine phosphoribosyltransferase